MDAVPGPGRTETSRSESADGGRRAAVCLALALLVMTAPTRAQEQVPAVWQERELSFSYGSAVAVYSCNALAGRVANILRAVGARDDLQVKVNHCRRSIAPPDPRINDPMSTGASDPLAGRYLNRSSVQPQSSEVQVSLMIPVEVTAEVLAELKRDKSRRELVSKVTGNPAARFNDPVLFAAQWQPVTLSRKTIDLEPKECELLDQMSVSVFRELGVNVVRRDFSCDPNRVSKIPPELLVEALLVTPFEAPAGDDAADPAAPAASDDDSTAPATDKSTE